MHCSGRGFGGERAGRVEVAGGGDETRPDATYEFSGTLKGDTLTVAFAGNKLPDVAPSEMKSLVWTLVKSGGKESLRIKFSGTNQETNRRETRFADFASCGEGYAELAKSAARVRFARGANSASFPASFKTRRERKSFLLNARAGQRLAVEAPGCGISFYYPDKSGYEEGTAIDAWSSDGLTQSGDYLFVITPAPEPGKCAISFKVTN
ncbi:MAG: hypothetical protein LC800_06965 [Acidobacteria bacterium]|nr:hypothetical protein [Acidobacteriota bacterium]